MKIEPRVLVEGPRGCGWRKVGGLYLVSGALAAPCPILPHEVTVCPCCGQGIKPARGWTWVSPQRLFEKKKCPDSCDIFYKQHGRPCGFKTAKKAGLIWIGGSFYRTAREFSAEADLLGVSRRIRSVPRDFVVGETWVLLAHRKAIILEEPEKGKIIGIPAIFQAFLPERIEKVVTEKTSQKELRQLVKRGVTPVIVKKDQEQTDLPMGKKSKSK